MSAEATAAALKQLVAFTGRIEWADIPEPVQRRAALVLSDDLAAMVAARDEPELRALQDGLAKSAGKPDALLHAARKLPHLAVSPLRQVHQLQLLIHLGAALIGRLARQFQPKPDIFAHGPPWQQAEGVFEQVAQAVAVRVVIGGALRRRRTAGRPADRAGPRRGSPP